MTNDLEMFRGPLKPIKRRAIKVGGGRLYSDKRGTVGVRDEKGRTRFFTSLYVPALGVNLLSIRRLCEIRLQGSFDEGALYIRDRQGRLVIRALVCNGVYIVDKVKEGLDEVTIIAAMTGEIKDIPVVEDISSSSTNEQYEPTDLNDESEADVPMPNASNNSKLKKYRFWHQRFAHIGKVKLENLHKITTWKKLIPIVKDPTPCRVCCTTKLINSRSRVLGVRKSFILAVVSIDLRGELPASWQGHRYFLKITDNHSGRTWIILLKRRADAVEALRKGNGSGDSHFHGA